MCEHLKMSKKYFLGHKESFKFAKFVFMLWYYHRLDCICVQSADLIVIPRVTSIL